VFDTPTTLYPWKLTFLQLANNAFAKYTHLWCYPVLTKRSTSVDQNFRSDNIYSQLSVAIFMTSRTHLGAQKSFIYWKKSEKLLNTWIYIAQKCNQGGSATRNFISTLIKYAWQNPPGYIFARYMTLARRGGSKYRQFSFKTAQKTTPYLFSAVTFDRRVVWIWFKVRWKALCLSFLTHVFRTFLNHFWLPQAVLKSQDQSKNVEISTWIFASSTLLLDKTEKMCFSCVKIFAVTQVIL
jgi:hypothetical protein